MADTQNSPESPDAGTVDATTNDDTVSDDTLGDAPSSDSPAEPEASGGQVGGPAAEEASVSAPADAIAATAASETVEATAELQQPEAPAELAPVATAPAPAEAAAPSAPRPETPDVAPVAEPEVPSIAATLSVPPLTEAPLVAVGTASEEGGGEWDLLIGKLRDWFARGELQARWNRIRGPLKGLGLLIGLVLLLRVYASIVGTIDAIPVVNGLLELVGLIAVGRFSADNLLRSRDREQVLSNLSQRWQSFRGRG